MPRRIVGRERGQQRLARAGRVADLVAAELVATGPERVEQLVVVADGTRHPGHRTAGPVGAETARLDAYDVDAEPRDLLPEAVGDALHRVLAAVIGRQAGECSQPAH